MTKNQMTSKEVAEKYKVGEATVNIWAGKFGAQKRRLKVNGRSVVRYFWTPMALSRLDKYKRLKDAYNKTSYEKH